MSLDLEDSVLRHNEMIEDDEVEEIGSERRRKYSVCTATPLSAAVQYLSATR